MSNFYTKGDLERVLSDFDSFERQVLAKTKKKISDPKNSPFQDLTIAYKSLREAVSIESQAMDMYTMPDAYSEDFSGLLGLTADAMDRVMGELEKARQSYEKNGKKTESN